MKLRFIKTTVDHCERLISESVNKSRCVDEVGIGIAVFERRFQGYTKMLCAMLDPVSGEAVLYTLQEPSSRKGMQYIVDWKAAHARIAPGLAA